MDSEEEDNGNNEDSKNNKKINDSDFSLIEH